MSTPKNLKPGAAYAHDLRGYVTGFSLAVVLTAVPFAMVAWGGLPQTLVLGTIALFALIQLVVHVHYFLHVDLSPERREDLYLIAFSGILLFIMVAGTLWIMVNLYTRMMGL